MIAVAEGTQHEVAQSAGPLVQAFECSRIGAGWLIPLGIGGFYYAVGGAGRALSWSTWLVVGFFVILVALGMAEVASTGEQKKLKRLLAR